MIGRLQLRHNERNYDHPAAAPAGLRLLPFRIAVRAVASLLLLFCSLAAAGQAPPEQPAGPDPAPLPDAPPSQLPAPTPTQSAQPCPSQPTEPVTAQPHTCPTTTDQSTPPSAPA
ncbi:MAG: hypothetical protein WCA37_02000, partial [Terracidiphilus sp.]